MTWKQRFAGYEFRHMLKIEFASDNERLGRILYVLANTDKITPEFRLSYTLKDTEKAKNDLLAKSVQDAREKAEVLAQAAGVSLMEMASISSRACRTNISSLTGWLLIAQANRRSDG